MRNMVKFIGVVAVVVITGLLMSACGDGSGSDIPVRVRAYDNSQGRGRSAALNTRSGMGMMPLSADINLTAYDTYLTNLGTATQRDPITFPLYCIITAFLSNGDHYTLQWGEFDFTRNLAVNVGNIEPGITVSAFHFAFGFNPDHKIQLVGGSETTPFDLFAYDSDYIDGITFYGSELKLHEGTLFIPGNTIPNPPYPGASPYTKPYQLVVPFDPVLIPSSASSATLNISMDLAGIVSDYGSNVYRLKRKWWESVGLTASIQ